MPDGSERIIKVESRDLKEAIQNAQEMFYRKTSRMPLLGEYFVFIGDDENQIPVEYGHWKDYLKNSKSD